MFAEGGQAAARIFGAIAQGRMFLAQGDQLLDEMEQALVFGQIIPVEPADGIVLAVGIVVAVLRIAEFVACQEHRCAAAAEEDGQGIADETVSQAVDFRVVGFAFGAAVPAVVVVFAVRIAPAIGLVVFFVVAVEVVQGETVMAGDEVDRGVFAAVEGVIEVVRTGQAVGDDRGQAAVALEETAQFVAVAAVPFRPAAPVRETADLVQAAGVPGFGDQLDIGQDRVVGQHLQQRRLAHR